ncbi:hypothetical protein [Psychrobacter raelei]|uniref:hypothetical protein n=1 Tax=Psychrobacter raelei TaxID=2565531 RepID=UPI003F5EAB65
MCKYFNIPATLSVALLLFSTPNIATAEVRSNVKPIPKAFVGEWVGLNRDKQKASKATVRSLCNHSYFKDDAYFVRFNPDRHRLTTRLYLEDTFYEYPILYTKYTPNHIAGKLLSIVYELGTDDDMVVKKVENFDYKIVNGEIMLNNDYGTYYLSRCY